MASRLSAFLRSPWGVVAKALFSVTLLAAFFFGIDLSKLEALWARVTWIHLVALAALTFGRNAIGAGRAVYVTRVIRAVPYLELLRQQFLASFFNSFLPTAIGGDGARVFYLRRCGIPATEGALLLLVERLIGFYALVLFASFSALFWDCPETLSWPIFGATAAYTAGLTWLFVAPQGRWIKWSLLERIRKVFALFHRNPALLLTTILWSLAYQGISIIISYYVAWVTLGEVSLLPFLTLVPLVWFFTMVPLTLGGVGLRELAFIALLALIGMAQEDALFISLGTYLALVMSGVVGGVLHLVGPVRLKEEKRQ